jgi:cell division protein FtsB
MRSYINIILIIFNIYIFSNIIFSQNGLIYINKLRVKQYNTQKQLQIISDENATLEKHISYLTEGTINKDYLEVQVKTNIGYSQKSEFLIITDDQF